MTLARILRPWTAGAGYLLMLSWGGCLAGSDPRDEAAPSLDYPDEMEAESLMSSVNVTVSKSAAWPRQVCWTSDHTTHNPHYWGVHWSSSEQQTSTSQICRTYSAETCNAWAYVSHDSGWHTSGTASTNVIDDRDFSIPSYTAPVNQSPSIAVPAPHGTRHCGGTGNFVFQVKSGSNWLSIPGSGVTPWSPTSSPTAGYETYRVQCSHPDGVTHYSNNFTVTWTTCGNGICESSEDAISCPGDCPCDGVCDALDPVNCPSDCQPLCGDWVCQYPETIDTCYGDCCTFNPQKPWICPQ